MTPAARHAPPADRPSSAVDAGVASALGAFLIWGFAPIYFKAVGGIPVLEVLAHRVVWSLVFLAVLLTAVRQWRAVGQALRSRRILLTLLATTVLISVNWSVFIWAVVSDRVLEVSLGYFMNPLVVVVIAMLFLKERLSRRQMLAVLLAAAGVLNLALWAGVVPWAGLALAVSFAFYGLLRKTAQIDALAGLAIETALLTPVAAGYLLLAAEGAGAPTALDGGTLLLLLAAGPVTALPLLLFTRGARRLRLSTIGLMQYISPSLQFVMAVWWWGEPFTAAHLVTYGCIWLALAVYTSDSLRPPRRAAATG